METMLYPTQFVPVAEEEMTYISGGADDILFNIVVGGAALAAIAVPIGIAVVYDKVNTTRLRGSYESETGLSAVDETGAFTTDFENYKQRSNMQGRSWLSGVYQGAVNTLAVVIKFGVPLAALGAGIWYMSATGGFDNNKKSGS